MHGDLWFGNTLWSGDRCTGLVDWDCAVMYGLPAAEQVLEGWQRAAGRRTTSTPAFSGNAGTRSSAPL